MKLNFNNILMPFTTGQKTWQIGISYSKCNILTIGNLSTQKFKLSTHEILNSNIVKDLGVLVDHKLNFKAHIEDCVVRARQRSALIFRGFLFRNTSNLVLAYNSFIRPLLEYAAPVWSPSLTHLNDSIESVQRAFTRRLPGLSKLTYCERLQKLKLQSLKHRRLLHDLVLCFKIVHGFSALQFTDFFKFSNTSFTRGHSLRLAIPLTKCSNRRNFFAYRVLKPWNSLPQHVVDATSPHSFKSRIASVDFSIFFKYPCINVHGLKTCL